MVLKTETNKNESKSIKQKQILKVCVYIKLIQMFNTDYNNL